MARELQYKKSYVSGHFVTEGQLWIDFMSLNLVKAHFVIYTYHELWNRDSVYVAVVRQTQMSI